MHDEIELLNAKLEDMKAKNRRLQGLYQNGGNHDDAKLIQKLKSDKLKLKGHLKVTRDNNAVLKSIVDELKKKNEEMEGHLQVSRAKVGNATNEIALLKQANEELTKKHEKLEIKAQDLEGNIEQLKMKESKLVSDLESCKSTDADLIISQREVKECNQNLENEEGRNRQCESARTTCADTLGDQVQINRNLQARNSNLSKSLDEARSSSSTNQRLAQRCQNQLEDEVEAKENLQEKFESVCPSWSEWSNCSKTCGTGFKKRTDRCSSGMNKWNEQVGACNQNICPSGKL